MGTTPLGAEGDAMAAVDAVIYSLSCRSTLPRIESATCSVFVDQPDVLVELPRMPLAAICAVDFARVPLIIGTARDEGMLHTLAYKKVSADELSRGGEGPPGCSRADDLGLRPGSIRICTGTFRVFRGSASSETAVLTAAPRRVLGLRPGGLRCRKGSIVGAFSVVQRA